MERLFVKKRSGGHGDHRFGVHQGQLPAAPAAAFLVIVFIVRIVDVDIDVVVIRVVVAEVVLVLEVLIVVIILIVIERERFFVVTEIGIIPAVAQFHCLD
jgi:hypothetical protein